MIIDTHCHLDDKSFDEDLVQVIQRAKAQNVENIIIPGADINDLPKAVKISEQFGNVYFAAGVHPYELDGFDLSVLESFTKHEKCVAIGECGLDYFRLPDSDVEGYKARQKECFEAQIDLAISLKKPIIIHARDANENCFEMLNARIDELVGGVMHCYNACPLFLDLSDKFYYGIGGVLTFKNEKKLGEILPKIPKERLLIETDAPYLAPVPKRGARNEPAFTDFVASKMSEILGLSKEQIEQITTENARRLFAI